MDIRRILGQGEDLPLDLCCCVETHKAYIIMWTTTWVLKKSYGYKKDFGTRLRQAMTLASGCRPKSAPGSIYSISSPAGRLLLRPQHAG
jgi:hypothetical protein